MDTLIDSLNGLTLEQDLKDVEFQEEKLCCQVISANEGDEKDFQSLQLFNPKKYHFFFGKLVNIACLHSHLDCLRYAIDKGFPLCRKALLYCAQSGSEQCFIECLQRGIEYDSQVYLWAIEHGQDKFLDFLFQNSFCPHPNSLKKAFATGRIDLVNYIFESGKFIIDEDIVDLAIATNNIDFKLFACYNLDNRYLRQECAQKVEQLAFQVSGHI